MTKNNSTDGVPVVHAALPVDRLEQVIDAYLEDYEMVGEAEDGRDACHQPTDDERALIKDAILGLLANEEWDAEWGKLIEQRAAARGVPAVVPTDEGVRFLMIKTCESLPENQVVKTAFMGPLQEFCLAFARAVLAAPPGVTVGGHQTFSQQTPTGPENGKA